ncbi:MAG: chorismate mutase [Betaproteobacteria bacterium]
MARRISASRLPDLGAVRARIDRIDRALAPLLAERFACAARAAHFKSSAAQAGAPARAAAVLSRVRALARRHGAPEQAIARVYREMIAAGVALERRLIAMRKNS